MVGATIDAMSEPAPKTTLRSFWSQLPREGRWLLSTVAIQLFGRGMTLPFTVIYLHEVRGIGLDVAGLLMAWIFTVGVLLTGPGGVAVDKYGARLVTLVACLVHMVGVVVLAFAETVPAAIVATTLMGVSGVTWPAFNSMVASIVQGPLRTQYFGVNFALVNLGIGVGGVVSGLYVDVSRPSTFTTIYLVDAVSLLIPVLLLLGPLRHVHARAEKPEDTTGIPTSYWQIARQPAMAWLLLLTFIAMFVGYGQMEAGFPAFAREASEVSTRTIGWAFAANTAVIVLAQFLVLRRIEGHRRTRVLMVMTVVWIISWTVLGLTGLVPGTLTAAFGVILFHVLFGFGETMLQPTVPAMTNDLAPDHLRGRYNALSSGVFHAAASPGRSWPGSCCATTRRSRSSCCFWPAAPRCSGSRWCSSAGSRPGPTVSTSRRSRPSRCSSGRIPRSTEETPACGHRSTSHVAALPARPEAGEHAPARPTRTPSTQGRRAAQRWPAVAVQVDHVGRAGPGLPGRIGRDPERPQQVERLGRGLPAGGRGRVRSAEPAARPSGQAGGHAADSRAGRPVSSSMATTPAAYRSWRGSGAAPATCSGAR